MRNRIVLASAMTAALLLAATASIVSANRLSINNRSFALAWAGLTFTSSSASITCPVVMGGTFHSNIISKTSRALIGFVNGAAVDTCTGDGAATILSETLPWHVAYNGFTGLLPRMSSVRLLLINASFRVSDGIACLARTDTSEPAGITASVEAGGRITRADADASFAIDLDNPEFFCDLAGDMNLSGSGSLIIGDIRDYLPSDGHAGDGGEALADSDALRPPNLVASLI